MYSIPGVGEDNVGGRLDGLADEASARFVIEGWLTP